jgi:hypothetical protein
MYTCIFTGIIEGIAILSLKHRLLLRCQDHALGLRSAALDGDAGQARHIAKIYEALISIELTLISR